MLVKSIRAEQHAALLPMWNDENVAVRTLATELVDPPGVCFRG
jgi:hypothetical protein